MRMPWTASLMSKRGSALTRWLLPDDALCYLDPRLDDATFSTITQRLDKVEPIRSTARLRDARGPRWDFPWAFGHLNGVCRQFDLRFSPCKSGPRRPIIRLKDKQDEGVDVHGHAATVLRTPLGGGRSRSQGFKL